MGAKLSQGAVNHHRSNDTLSDPARQHVLSHVGATHTNFPPISEMFGKCSPVAKDYVHSRLNHIGYINNMFYVGSLEAVHSYFQ